MIATGDAQPRHEADINFRYVLDLNRHAIGLGQDDVLDVIDLVALGEIVAAAVVDQADAADVDRLLADLMISRPPTLTLALPSAATIWGTVTL